MKLIYFAVCSLTLLSSSCASPSYGELKSDVAQARLVPDAGQDVRATEAKFCAGVADNLQTRAQFNQNWAIFITGFGAVATAAGSGASLVAAQTSENSSHRSELLQAGAVSTAVGLAALGLAAIFDWNGLSKSQRVASASMAEASTRILSSPRGSADEQTWFQRCTDSGVKLAEDIPNVSPPTPASPSAGTAGGSGAGGGGAGASTGPGVTAGSGGS